MKVSGIPFIVVADAKITPDHNEVLILENSKIGQLKIQPSSGHTHGYHRLTTALWIFIPERISPVMQRTSM